VSASKNYADLSDSALKPRRRHNSGRVIGEGRITYAGYY
jgi:hypothetical protein